MNLRFDKRAVNSVVHIRCGSSYGTAFFVSRSTLLTARHTVVSVLDKADEHLEVYVNGKWLQATAHSEGDEESHLDIARLDLDAPIDSVTPLNLLALDFEGHPEFMAVGFPCVAGMGEVASWYEVTYEHEIANHPFATHITNISEVYSIQSLKGISGGPILSESGSVVGVATFQQGRALGFSSTLNYLTIRKAESTINVNVDTGREDYSTYGLGQSIALTKKTILTVGNRYNRTDNVDNRKLFEVLHNFCDYKSAAANFERISRREEDAAEFFNSAQIEITKRNGQFDYVYTYDNLDKKKDDIKPLNNGDTIHSCVLDLRKLYRERETYATQFMLLKGKAGTGKTHTLCRFLDTYSEDANRYFLLGSYFVPTESVSVQICEKLGFDVDGFKNLENAMSIRNKWAIFVIDALNEGANESYWRSAVIELFSIIKECPHLKLIVSVREPYDNSIFDRGTKGWQLETIDGFQEVDEAMSKFLHRAHIPIGKAMVYRQELKNPLFMNIFCKTYNQLTLKEQASLKKINLFESYLKVRNGKVCEIADEDPHNNITLKMAQKLCHYSLFYRECDLVSRSKARILGNRIIRREGWHNSLLNAMITEGLLLENLADNLIDEQVQIEYEKMDDYLKAKELLVSKMDANQIIDFVIDMYRRTHRPDYDGNATKFINMLSALIAMWSDFDKCEKVNLLENKNLEPILKKHCEAFKNESGKFQSGLLEMFYDNAQPINAALYWDDRKEKPLTDYQELHRKLKAMEQPVRDFVWAEPVNILFDKIQDYFSIFNLYNDTKDGEQKMLILLGWFLASSYPKGRCAVARELYSMITSKPDLAEQLMNLFVSCNECYVLEGILSVIYGACITLHDSDFSKKMAEIVSEKLISQKSVMLDDLHVRQWALKILENADYENDTTIYFHELNYPLSDNGSPLDLLTGDYNKPSKNIFGESQGSYKLWYSLFDFSDFNRYIIGTNNRPDSNVFFLQEPDGTYKGISLYSILNALKGEIRKHWNDHLGQLDNNRYSTGRYDNEKERIGKKYQWLALHNIEGRLLDYCSVARWDEYISNPKKADFVTRPMPWHTGDDSRFDPTLVNNSEIENLLAGIFGDENPHEHTVGKSTQEWLDDTSEMPQLRFIYQDLNGEEWILLQGYDTHDINTTDGKAQEFVFYNSGFVRNADEDTMKSWAATKCFYGRWMPEHRNGDTQTLWNEFPWTQCYKDQKRDQWEEVYDNDNCPSKILLPYETLLQEHSMGLPAPGEYQSEVLAPCADIMNTMKLRTSNIRGLMEDVNKEVVALNLCPFIRSKNNGLLIKRTLLEEYLDKKGLSMFYFILGEKTKHLSSGVQVQLDLNKTDLSAAAKFIPQGEIDVFQPMCNKGSLEKTSQEDDFEIDPGWIDGTKPLPPMTSRQALKVMDMIKRIKLEEDNNNRTMSDE